MVVFSHPKNRDRFGTERHRKKEIELIQLLSFPLSHWMALKEEEETAARSASHLPRAKEPQSDQGVPGEKPLPNEELLHSPISKSKTSPTTLTKNAIIRQELNNVKTLCAQVLKGHKKLSQQLKECQEQLEHQQPKIVHAYKLDNESFLQELHQQQMIHFRRQLIALDMKERAFLARVKQVEEQCQNQCSEQFLHWKQSMEDWKRQVDQQWKEREKKQDQEMKRNARIRQNIGQRVDQPYSPRDRTDYQVRGDHHHGQDDVTPILFSTNLGEIREYVPLPAKVVVKAVLVIMERVTSPQVPGEILGVPMRRGCQQQQHHQQQQQPPLELDLHGVIPGRHKRASWIVPDIYFDPLLARPEFAGATMRFKLYNSLKK